MKTKHKFAFIVVSALATCSLWYSLSKSASRSVTLLKHSGRIGHLISKPQLGDHHLIFIETSCADASFHTSERGLLLSARQACSIESAAKANPTSTVYLLHTCPIHEGAYEASRLYVRRLLTYPNVRLWQVVFEDYFHDTPLELFYKTGSWLETDWPKEHSSDVLRFLTLWKFGGTYMDLDMVVRRPLSDLGTNYAAAESDQLLASSVLNFGDDVIGREVARQCLTELTTDFRGYDWGYNGPGLISRVMARICGVNQTTAMTPERCSGFTVHPASVFFPVTYEEPDLQLLFNQSYSEDVMRRLEGSHAVHIWNKLSHAKVVVVGSRQPYGLLAQEFCPKVYYHCGSIF